MTNIKKLFNLAEYSHFGIEAAHSLPTKWLL